jgi:hypothetical protein
MSPKLNLRIFIFLLVPLAVTTPVWRSRTLLRSTD